MNYFDTFEPERVKQGEAISRTEMVRRLAFHLQVPQRFGNRLMAAFEATIHDAVKHGEGIKFKEVGTLSLQRYDTDTYKGFGKLNERVLLYKFKWSTSHGAERFLKEISDLDRKGVLDDYFQKP